MSDYINPKNESKEDFLEREAVEISRGEFISQSFYDPNHCLPFTDESVSLCLAQNKGFSVCVVAYNEEEAEHYADSTTDKRPKRYFLIDRAKLRPVVKDYEGG